MTGANRLKARLAAGETVCAMWVEWGAPDIAEAMVHGGWDVIVIDCEHGSAGLEAGLSMIPRVEAAGGEAVIRVPDLHEATFKRALDRGARSIMAPMVNTPEDAARVAGFCRYPPLGRRGYAAPIVRASRWGARPDYRAGAHDELLLMAQIEHVDAARDFAAIATTPGIDMAFVGPNDLAGSIGMLERLETPEVGALLADIEAKARAAGTWLGTITGATLGYDGGPGRDWADLKRLGYRFIVGPNDVSLLMNAARAEAARRDSALG
jgi:4-hydroxy-2-oxoheptanedioate aldolase